MRVFSGADKRALELEMQRVVGQQEAQAQEAINKCIDRMLRDLPASQNTLDARMKIADQCRSAQKEAQRKAPPSEWPFVAWLVLGAAAVGGTMVGVQYFRSRRTTQTY